MPPKVLIQLCYPTYHYQFDQIPFLNLLHQTNFEILQTKLNPTPPDPLQAKIMTYLPVVFLFLFATFPAGLVIYWTWNNVLSIGQQWVIMKRTS